MSAPISSSFTAGEQTFDQLRELERMTSEEHSVQISTQEFVKPNSAKQSLTEANGSHNRNSPSESNVNLSPDSLTSQVTTRHSYNDYYSIEMNRRNYGANFYDPSLSCTTEVEHDGSTLQYQPTMSKPSTETSYEDYNEGEDNDFDDYNAGYSNKRRQVILFCLCSNVNVFVDSVETELLSRHTN